LPEVEAIRLDIPQQFIYHLAYSFEVPRPEFTFEDGFEFAKTITQGYFVGGINFSYRWYKKYIATHTFEQGDVFGQSPWVGGQVSWVVELGGVDKNTANNLFIVSFCPFNQGKMAGM